MSGKIKKAMVLAAGYGVRLKPLTDRLPKPLVPVAGKPMIEYALDRLRAYGIEEVVINVSHLKEQLVAYVSGITDLAFRISEETEPLETGGGLKQALPLLGNEPVFTINSDIIWFDEGEITSPSPPQQEERAGERRPVMPDEKPLTPTLSPLGQGEGVNFVPSGFQQIPESALQRLARSWDDAKMDVLLLVQPKAKAVGYDQGEDHLFVHPDNTIEWNEREAPYIIAGVGIIHPRILANAPDGKFSVKVLWRRALEQKRLFCLPHHGRWFQTGSLKDIQATEERLN